MQVVELSGGLEDVKAFVNREDHKPKHKLDAKTLLEICWAKDNP